MTDTEQILATMTSKDTFSKWLGIVIDEYREGYCRLHYAIRPDMLNGFEMLHGGVIFSAADSAFAFACNSQGIISVALDVNISFIRAGKVGDILTVTAKEIHTGNKTAFYDIATTNDEGETIAIFKGTAYRTSKSVL
jgi:acyl-CoA thioesterase